MTNTTPYTVKLDLVPSCHFATLHVSCRFGVPLPAMYPGSLGVVSFHSVGLLRSNCTGTLTHDTPNLLNKSDTRDSMGQNFCSLTNKQDRIGGRPPKNDHIKELNDHITYQTGKRKGGG